MRRRFTARGLMASILPLVTLGLFSPGVVTRPVVAPGYGGGFSPSGTPAREKKPRRYGPKSMPVGHYEQELTDPRHMSPLRRAAFEAGARIRLGYLHPEYAQP
jgi:hypothetical protein